MEIAIKHDGGDVHTRTTLIGTRLAAVTVIQGVSLDDILDLPEVANALQKAFNDGFAQAVENETGVFIDQEAA